MYGAVPSLLPLIGIATAICVALFLVSCVLGRAPRVYITASGRKLCCEELCRGTATFYDEEGEIIMKIELREGCIEIPQSARSVRVCTATACTETELPPRSSGGSHSRAER